MHDDTTTTPRGPARAEDLPTSSRRSMLRKAGLGAAGAAAIAVAGARPAGAADGEDLTLGDATNAHTSFTNTRYAGAPAPVSFVVEAASATEATANDGILNGAFPNAGAAFMGVAGGSGSQTNGVIGWSKKPGGTGVIGFTGGAGSYGGEFFGGLAEVRLRPGGDAPITSTVAHQVGELFEDSTGALWLCTGAGTPGTWREIAGPTTAGAFHTMVPQRVFDSRTPAGGGKLLADSERTISVADALSGTLAVPPGATGCSCTVTVTGTEGTGGYVSVRPGGTTWAGTSSINWFGPNQDLATTAISGLGGDRQLTLRAGGAATHVVVDVTGFYR